METLQELLRLTTEMGGSDLHLTAGAPLSIRVNGELRRLDDHQVLTAEETRTLVYSRLSQSQRNRHEDGRELDLSFGTPGLARFRCNVFKQRGAVAAVYRLIPDQIKTFQELGLPPVVQELTGLSNGLVLIAGPAGSGKSTTLATMIDTINVERKGTFSPSKTRSNSFTSTRTASSISARYTPTPKVSAVRFVPSLERIRMSC